MNILVLGAGRMGLGAAWDLAYNSKAKRITVADVDASRVEWVAAKVASEVLVKATIDVEDFDRTVALMRGHDAVISCVVYRHNVRLAQAAIAAGANFCDLGGNNDTVAAELALHPEAEAAGINIIPDCGLAPGMLSLLVMHGVERFEQIDEVHMRVGGLPQHPRPPLDYQMVFSVEGLINEYVEPAQVIRDGEIRVVESMTEIETLTFPEPFGVLEAFQTSGGTSTLPETLRGRVRELDYKTIRYPGHCERFKTMIDLGLASSKPVVIDGREIVPRRLLGELIVRNLPADEPDVVLIRVEFEGRLAGKQRKLRYDIIDRYDERTGLSAMMRTTAFPASIVAQLMAEGATLRKGALPQERCIPVQRFVDALKERGIAIDESFVK